MDLAKPVGVLLVCLLAAAAGAQTIVNDVPALIGFVDISATGGTPLPNIGDDSVVTVSTSIGNDLFPAGNIRISNNGVVITGSTTAGVNFMNQAIPPGGVPLNLSPGGSGYFCILWDDHRPNPDPSSATIWVQDLNGVLYVMWKNEDHFFSPQTPQGLTTFEMQVFGSPGCGPFVQYLYPDATYAAGNPFNNGLSATVGYLNGTNASAANVQYSFNTSAAIPDGTVLTINRSTFTLAASSPFGPGSLQVDLSGGTACSLYLLAVTLHQGVFPNGWLFGVDIPVIELLNEIAIGPPFLGPLSGGAITLGPFGGLPRFTFYAVGIAVPYLGVHTQAISYTIP